MEEKSNKLKLILSNDNHSVWLSILLHLFPGILAALVYFPVAQLFWNNNIPTVLAIHVVLMVILVPLELGIILFSSKKKTDLTENTILKIKLPSIILNTNKNSKKDIILYSFLSLFWAVLILGFVDKQLVVSDWIFQNWFNWLPEFYDMTGVYTNPEQYSNGIRVLVLILSLIIGAIIGPFIEEIYFRGFLMPRIVKNKWFAPVLNAVLFALYHLWTPWMIPMRILAVLPFIFLVWWKKDIKIGIYSHIALNLLGDVIMVIPLLFP